MSISPPTGHGGIREGRQSKGDPGGTHGRDTVDILNGIKVIDVTAWAFVPSAGGVLAHWGADVIKVESPGAPDPMRLLGGTLEPGASSAAFKHYSRGKRSMAIDLASDEGNELLYRLVAGADVFLTSYLAPTRRKLGIDVADIRRVNPSIIYAKGSGYGAKGPDADHRGYDLLGWWSRGSLAQSAMDVSGSDWPTGMVGHGDGMSGLVFAGGICAALLKRERSGETSVVDASLMGTAAWFNGMALLGEQARTPKRRAGPVRRPPLPADFPPSLVSALNATYQTSDFRFINLLFLGDDDRDFADLAARIGQPELVAADRFCTAAQRRVGYQELQHQLEQVFAAHPLTHWKVALAGSRGAWAPVQTPTELITDPQTVANGFIRPIDHAGGSISVPVPPIQFDGEAGDPPRAPDFAEHTDQILTELGYSREDIHDYRQRGTVA